MRRIVSIVMSCLAGQTLATDYYVATNGSDSAAGTIGAPFATIQKAADEMGAGDTCHIRGGTYHEEVVVNNLDGTAGSPVVFTAYSNEVVTLDGSQDVSELGASGWTLHSGNIYKTTLSNDISQVFVDREWMMLARWPNARFDDESAWTRDNWAQGDEAASVNGHEVDDPSSGHDLAAAGLDMTGAMGVLNLGNFVTQAKSITTHGAGVGNFIYGSSMSTYKTVNHYYFFDSKLNLLDNETEWYFDPSTKTLYLWAPGGGIPANVRGKNQDNALFFTGCEYVEVKGLNFFATTFRMETCDKMTVEDCDLEYPCFNKRTLGDTGEIFGTRIEGCTYVTVKNCSFAKTDGLVMKIRQGNNNTVENCLFHHLDYTVAHHSGNSGFLWFNSSEFGTFRNNTVYTTGASEGLMTSADMLVELNDISGVGHLQSDGAVVHLFQGQENVDVTRNWFHGNEKPALRMSDGPKDTLPVAMIVKGVARHNVVFDQDFLSLQFKGDLKEGYNNLTEGYIRYSDDSANPTSSLIHANSICINNATGDFIDFVAPTRTESNNWEEVVEGVAVETQVRDWANLDFRPAAGSDFIDAGAVVPGITDGYLGAAPDIGTYESGASNYWIPGRKLSHASSPVPPDRADAVQLDADLMWLEGYKATSHDVYFGTDPGALVSQGNYTNNIFDPGTLSSNTVYYWRVDTVTPSGIVPGAIWQMNTGVAVEPVLTFTPLDDAYVQDTAPDDNFGFSTQLKLITQVSYGYNRDAYIKFNVDVTQTILSATLELHNSGGTHNKQVGVYSMTDTSWEEETITWSNRPAIDGSLLDKHDVNSGQWASFDVSSAVVSNGPVSFGLIRDALDTQRIVDSKESAYAPVLTVEYAVNNPPVFITDPFSASAGIEGSSYANTLALRASDPDGDSLTYSKLGGPAWLAVASNGTLTGTPASGDVGENIFTLQVADGSGSSDVATLSIIVDTVPSGGWAVLTSDDFESGWGNWVDGGDDALLSTSYAIGTQCVNLQDDAGDASSTWLASPLDLTGYSKLKVEFTYMPVSLDNADEDFWVQYSDDGGSSWTNIKVFVKGVDFENNTRDNPVLTMDSTNYNFTANAKVKFVCDASGNGDDVYIDDVVISGYSAGQVPTSVGDVSLVINGGNLIIAWTGEAGGSYAVQCTTNLVSGTWSNVVEGVTGIGSIDVTNAITGPKVFYRTVLE